MGRNRRYIFCIDSHGFIISTSERQSFQNSLILLSRYYLCGSDGLNLLEISLNSLLEQFDLLLDIRRPGALSFWIRRSHGKSEYGADSILDAKYQITLWCYPVRVFSSVWATARRHFEISWRTSFQIERHRPLGGEPTA